MRDDAAGDLPPVDVVVPDDPRALRRDVRALRKERKVQARQRRRHGRMGPSLAVGLALVGGAAAFGLLLALLVRPDQPARRAQPLPLASPAISPGAVGGLLPDVTLAGRAKPERARDLRPGIVMLVAPGCDCVASARSVASDAAPFGLVTYLVESGSERAHVELLAARANGLMAPLLDPDGALARAYGLRTEAALVLVRADGVVTHVIDAVGPSLRLTPALRALVSSASPAAS